MSFYFMEHGKPEVRDWGPSRTKQAFKDDTDMNMILARFSTTGALDHLSKYQAQYGDFSDYPDLMEAHARIERGTEIFDALPAELRQEFGQSPGNFFKFVNDPLNKDRLKEIYPELAEPGRYPLDMSIRTPPGGSMDPDAPDPDVGVPPPATPPSPPGTGE